MVTSFSVGGNRREPHTIKVHKLFNHNNNKNHKHGD